MNKKQIISYIKEYLDDSGEYEFKPCYNSFTPGHLQWIKIEKVD